MAVEYITDNPLAKRFLHFLEAEGHETQNTGRSWWVIDNVPVMLSWRTRPQDGTSVLDVHVAGDPGGVGVDMRNKDHQIEKLAKVLSPRLRRASNRSKPKPSVWDHVAAEA